MERDPARKKLIVPAALVVTVLGAAAASVPACGGGHDPEVCVVTDDAGVETPCDAGPPDAPIV